MTDTMTREEAEEIYMAAQMGANYPQEQLAMAVLLLSQDEETPVKSASGK